MLRLTKTYTLAASADEVWRALTDPDVMAEWMGEEVVMNAWPDGSFSLWDGSVLGINREVAEHKHLVQEWKEDHWTHYSRVEWKLAREGGATRVELVHEQIPVASFQRVDKLWDQNFFLPLKTWIEG